MTTDEIDLDRRRFLTKTTAVVGGIGALCASVPFLASWTPSAKTEALGAPVEVDLGKIELGQKITVSWRGQPVFVVHRSETVLQELKVDTAELRDPDSRASDQPDYAKNEYRSRNPLYLIVMGICTHLGCVPLYHPEKGKLDATWPGGFFCPCHGSKYDLAGRVYKGVPAPLNLPVPPYRYLSENVVLIGEDETHV